MQNKTQIKYGTPSARITWTPQGAIGTPYEGKNVAEMMAMIARSSNPKELQAKAEKPEVLFKSAIHGEIPTPNAGEYGQNTMGGHWSILETLAFGVEITLSKTAAAQLGRHDAADNMNEKSNRYGRHSSAFFGFTHIAPVAYLAGSKAREPSDKLAPFDAETVDVDVLSWEKYEAQIARGVSLQDARASLTQNAATQININTTFRDAFSFLSQRLFHAAQHEIRFIAHQLLEEMRKHFADVMQYFDFSDAYNVQFFDAMVLKKHASGILKKGDFDSAGGKLVFSGLEVLKGNLNLNRMTTVDDFERLQHDYKLITEQANAYLETQNLT